MNISEYLSTLSLQISKEWNLLKKMYNLKCYYDYQQIFVQSFRYDFSVHDRITSLRGEACVHKTSLIPPPYIEVPVPRPERELSCICVLGLSILLLSAILIFDFGIFP